MNAYNPLASMKRLEQAGFDRQHAEAIASEIGGGMSELVTREQLDAALTKQTIRLTAVIAALLTLASTVIGTVMALVAAH